MGFVLGTAAGFGVPIFATGLTQPGAALALGSASSFLGQIFTNGLTGRPPWQDFSITSTVITGSMLFPGSGVYQAFRQATATTLGDAGSVTLASMITGSMQGTLTGLARISGNSIATNRFGTPSVSQSSVGPTTGGVSNIPNYSQSLAQYSQVNVRGSGGAPAGGGFVLYPNKPNLNMMQTVYAK